MLDVRITEPVGRKEKRKKRQQKEENQKDETGEFMPQLNERAARRRARQRGKKCRAEDKVSRYLCAFEFFRE